MPIDALQRYIALRESLLRERDEIQSRLSDISKALGGEIPVPLVKPMGGEVSSPTAAEGAPMQRRRRKRRMSPEARARIAAAAKARWAKAKAAGRSRL